MTFETIAQAFELIDQDRMMTRLRRLCRFDRFQASDQINEAADFVFSEIDATGPARIDFQRHLLHETVRWWTFDPPTPWTPRKQTLALPDGLRLSLDQAPFLVAVNSAPLPSGRYRVRRPGRNPPTPSLCVVPGGQFDPDSLVADGVTAFVTNFPAARTQEGHYAGRIELPPNCGLTGFSVTDDVLARFETAADRQEEAEVGLEVGTGAPMPVLSWTLPGDVEGEIWVMAHLCHPRPGANDNASGVIGLLEISDTLTRLWSAAKGRIRKTVRFISAPEFTGIAAFLHERIRENARAPLPEAVVNLDMIGQNTARCGGLFRIERAPDPYASALTALAEHAVTAVFATTGHDWSPMPFHGYSDNSVFAGGAFAVPTVQFCHDRDAFNHSAGDSPDKICPAKMAAVVASAVCLVDTLAYGNGSASAILEQWNKSEAAKTDAIANFWCTRGYKAWSVDFASDRMNRLNMPTDGPATPFAIRHVAPGPLNLRHLIAGLDPVLRRRVSARIADEKRFYARLLNAIITYMFTADAETAPLRASFALEHPFAFADTELISSVLTALPATGGQARPGFVK
ncbi:MAG: DUF4910 domain-containing protein [Pseudomonadota bacterium]